MQLYIFPPSPNAIKVELIINHLGLDVERKIVNTPAGDQKTPEFLKLNPNGKMPVLVDGDFNLWESNAIMQYLAGQTENSLWPKGDRIRADIARWQFWQSAHFGQACGTLLYENLVKPRLQDLEPDPAAIERGIEVFAFVARVLNTHLEGRDFIVSDTLTLADIAIASDLAYWQACKIPLEDYPNIKRWFDDISDLSSWQSTVAAATAGLESNRK